MDQCHDHQCSSGHEHQHSHSHGSSQSCGCCCGHCCCGCCCKGCGHEECGSSCDQDFSKLLLEMADDAWMEVLKDKIKEQIIKSSGSRLDQLAQLVAETNKNKWKHKLAKKSACDDYKNQIAEFFSHGA